MTSNSIYSRRKRFLPEYREFFQALLNIPDEDVRGRVIQAVNGTQKCSVCKNKFVYMRDIGTQTESISETLNGNSNATEILDKTEDTIPKQQPFEKRRRKRKRNYPKVVKTAQHSTTTPVLEQENSGQKETTEQPHPAKLIRTDSDTDDNAITCVLNTIDLENPAENFKSLENIKKQMKVEWETSQIFSGAGLLPIHDAIVQNDRHKLKRQIYVWKFRQVNLSDLRTEDQDNVIQLAIKENCFKIIFDELLKEDIALDDMDDDRNSVIHLAVCHLVDEDLKQHSLKILESLLMKIDLKLLLEQNNDGLTALHIAVKNNEYLMIEKILNVLDHRLNLNSVSLPTKPLTDQEFLRHYCGQCDSFEGREQHELKTAILNATDMKRGCSVLFFAMELGYEQIVYLLLAHMCNPTIKNFAGLDAKSYYTDYGTNPGISGALEKLTLALQK